jgi:hypothetical protein
MFRPHWVIFRSHYFPFYVRDLLYIFSVFIAIVQFCIKMKYRENGRGKKGGNKIGSTI